MVKKDFGFYSGEVGAMEVLRRGGLKFGVKKVSAIREKQAWWKCFNVGMTLEFSTWFQSDKEPSKEGR